MANEGMTREQATEFIHKEVDRRLWARLLTGLGVLGIVNVTVIWGLYKEVADGAVTAAKSKAETEAREVSRKTSELIAKDEAKVAKAAMDVEVREAKDKLIEINNELSNLRRDDQGAEDYLKRIKNKYNSADELTGEITGKAGEARAKFNDIAHLHRKKEDLEEKLNSIGQSVSNIKKMEGESAEKLEKIKDNFKENNSFKQKLDEILKNGGADKLVEAIQNFGEYKNLDDLVKKMKTIEKRVDGDSKKYREKLQVLEKNIGDLDKRYADRLGAVSESLDKVDQNWKSQISTLSERNGNLNKQVVELNKGLRQNNELLSAMDIMPVGTILPWHRDIRNDVAGRKTVLPKNWVYCDGGKYKGFEIPVLNSQKYAGGRGIYLRGGKKSGGFNESTYLIEAGTYKSEPDAINPVNGSVISGGPVSQFNEVDGVVPNQNLFVRGRDTLGKTRRIQVAAMTVVWIIKIK